MTDRNTEILEFLAARLDAAETAARNAIKYEGAGLDGPAWLWAAVKDGSHRFSPGAPSPQDVLDDVAAKRELIRMAQANLDALDPAAAALAAGVLDQLASCHPRHADYPLEWAHRTDLPAARR